MDPVVVGRIGSPHGVAGAVRVTSSTHPPENIERYRPWLVDEGQGYRELQIESLRDEGGRYVARFEDISNREQARKLAGLEIAVPRSALPDPGEREHYWRDLVGMRVEGIDGTSLGNVERLLSTGAHDVLVIVGDGGETLVPFVDAFVREVDDAARRIVVEWQEPV